jgi:DNA-binding YbaB/EbfC family protein
MNIRKMMKQAQEVQERMQREIAAIEVESSVGGGMVSMRMNGQKLVLQVRIDPEVLDPADPTLVQDLVLAAVNDAARRVDEEVQARLGSLTGLQGLGGLGLG